MGNVIKQTVSGLFGLGFIRDRVEHLKPQNLEDYALLGLSVICGIVGGFWGGGAVFTAYLLHRSSQPKAEKVSLPDYRYPDGQDPYREALK